MLPGLRLWWRNDRCGYVKKRRAKRESREAFHAEEDAELEQYDGVTEEYNSLVLQVRSPTMNVSI